jgi:hypothetical protein
MFLVTTTIYPPDKAVQVAKKFIKATEKPFPSFMKRLYVLTGPGGAVGMKVLGIYEVDDAKLKEGIKEINKYYAQFFDVEGFRYDVEPMLPAAEAIPLLGI